MQLDISMNDAIKISRSIKSFILLVFLQMGIFTSKAQTYAEQPSIASPSVNEKFNINANVDVDLYRGRNNVDIPIYSFKVGENAINIGLNYVAGNGVKVKDVSGYYGMGWNLNAGGAVSRYVMGIPDEEAKGYCGTERFGTTLNSFTESTLTTAILDKIGKDGYDGEPDVFFVRTPYFKFQFSLDHNGNVVLPNSNGFKVVHNLNNNSNYTNTNFEIVDNFGNRFFFGSSTSARETTTTKLGTLDKTFVTSWFLDQIIWFNEKSKVNYFYASASNSILVNSVYNKVTFSTSPTCSISDVPETKVDYTQTINSPKYLSRIESINARLDLAYEFNREDVSSMPKLVTITAYSLRNNTTTLLHTYSLKYNYSGTTVAANKRLFLTSVDKLDGASWVQLFAFEYYNDNPLPSLVSKEFDYWGYYNTNSTGAATVPTANKQPDIGRTISGVLKSVKYLTGQKDVFTYEANRYYDLTTSSNVVGPGIRVKRLSVARSNNEEINYTDFIYQESNGNSTGEIQSDKYKQFTKQLNLLIVGGSGYCGIAGTTTSSNSSFADENINDLQVGYSKVIKKMKDNSREEYYYTNFSQFPDLFVNKISNSTTYAFESSRQLNIATSRAFKRGILTKKLIYSASQIVSENIYEYSNLGNSETMSSMRVKVSPQTIVLGANITVWLYGVAYAMNDVYRLTKERNIEYSTFLVTDKIETTTDYVYAANGRQVRKVIVSNSRGGNAETIKYYPTDNVSLTTNPLFTAGDLTLFNELTSKNLIDNVVYSKIINGNYVSEMSTYFEKATVGSISKYFQTKVKNFINGLVSKEVFTTYNKNTANLISVTEKDNLTNAYIWSQDGQYPIAKVINATDTIDIAYTSFEGGDKGSWTYNGIPDFDLSSPTGTRVFKIVNSANNITKSGLSATKSYIVTYWKKNSSGAVLVNGGTGTAVLVIGGWTCFKHKVINPSSGLISVSGTNSIIDELRLYPNGSQMNTYCYNPLVGMTNACDVNNLISYYEYDGWDRLSLVRDQEKRIINKYCYNYSGQPEACSTYTNQVQSANFVKACTGCMTGSIVTYTVPEGAYTATSLPNANILAQQDIASNGQAYANSFSGGTCTTPVSFSLKATNQISVKNFNISLVNANPSCSSFTYTYTLNGGSSNVTLGTLQSGNYNVIVTPVGGNTTFTCTIGSQSKEGVSGVSFSAVPIPSGTTITITSIF